MTMIVIQGTLPIRPEKREAVAAAAAKMRAATIVEEGCVAYRFGWAIDDPNVMMVAEQWSSAETLAAHSKSDHLAAFGKAVADGIGGAPEVTKFEIASAGPLGG